ncbi:MAG TPA: FtsW/RodA/SpoVE family cell cycle protein, partial [Anaerolineae bacterium]|nr:FtsW/RodA/SpoVE family cell cycle protein [Anaerolineae bacterium]
MIKEICRNLDYTLLLTVVMLIIIGIIMIHSASTGENIESSGVWKKQIFWAFFSLVIMLAMVPIPQKFLYAFSYVFYGVGLLLLILTELYGAIGGGSERWLVFGPVRFQPSEFMKIATIFTLARFLSYKKNRPTSYTKCIVPFLIICVPMILVRMQPDLGTSLVFGALVLPMLYWAGLDIVRIFFLIAPVLSAIFTAPFIPISNPVLWAVFMFILLSLLFYSRYRLPVMGIIIGTNILAGIATPYVFTHLEPYQQSRITTIFNPEADPLDSGYQLINSKIAIGSGGLL